MAPPSFSARDGCERKVVVGVGSLAASNDRATVLSTYSLGSCLGITLYDPVARAGGLLHAMLPDSSINSEKAQQQPAMFVDTGLRMLFRSLYKLGAEKHRMQICAAGGAKLMDEGGFFKIGERNLEAFQGLLRQHQLCVHAQQLGGWLSRTLHLHIQTGLVRLKASGKAGETLFGGSCK